MDIAVEKLKQAHEVVFQGKLNRENARPMKLWYYFGWWTRKFKVGRIEADTLRLYYNNAKSIYKIAPDMELQEFEHSRENIQWLLDEYGKSHEYETCKNFKNRVLASLKTAVEDGFIDSISIHQVELRSVESSWPQDKVYEKIHRPKVLSGQDYLRFKEYVDRQLRLKLKQAPIITAKGRNSTDGYHSQFSEQAKLMILVILSHTGCRYSESLGIQLCDVKENYIIIDKTWDYKHGTGFKKTKNLSSMREVYVDATLINLLKQFSAWKAEHYGVIQGLPLVIEPRSSHNCGTINRFFKSIQKDLGFSVILSTHKLRHTYISYLLEQGVEMKMIADQVGHRDTLMIQRVYGHLLDERRTKERAKIANLLK